MGARLFTIVLVSLCSSQTIGTVHVFLSNRDLFRTMTDLHGRGFATVPNERVFPFLLDPVSAFCGGLFLTFTVGAGLVAASLLLTRLIGRRGRFPAFAALILLLVPGLFWVNHNGFNPMGSALWIVPPVLAGGLALKFLPGTGGERSPWRIAAPAACFVLSLPFLLPAAGTDGFLDLRDRLLLSNAPGRAASDFYYRYTLSAAEAVKSFDQKLIRTFRLEGLPEGEGTSRLGTLLEREDVLPTSLSRADLVIRGKGEALSFGTPGKTVFPRDFKTFLSGPRKTLAEFSRRTDRWAFIRATAFHSLVLLYPALLYLVLFALVLALLPRAAGRHLRPLLASGLALVLFLGGLHLAAPGRRIPDDRAVLLAMLQSGVPAEQTRALRTLSAAGKDVASFPEFEALGESPSPAVRYWFARSLAGSRSERAQVLLFRLLEDGQMNVVTMAIESLGMRGDPAAAPAIRNMLETSPHWYVQLYAYRALRRLGWSQTG
jgi:hypothetical protein